MTQAERTLEIERACKYVRAKLRVEDNFTEPNKHKWIKDAVTRFKVSETALKTILKGIQYD